MSINDQLRDFKKDYGLNYEELSSILLFSAAALKAWIEGDKHRPSSQMAEWINKTIQTYRRNKKPPRKEVALSELKPKPALAMTKAEKKWPRGISPKRIKRFLIAFGWTTEDLAKEIGVSEVTVKRWVIGSFVPQRRFQHKLLELLRYGPKVPSQQEVVDIVTTSIKLLPPLSPDDIVGLCRDLKKGRQNVAPMKVLV